MSYDTNKEDLLITVTGILSVAFVVVFFVGVCAYNIYQQIDIDRELAIQCIQHNGSWLSQHDGICINAGK